jgi:hypothetical protein
VLVATASFATVAGAELKLELGLGADPTGGSSAANRQTGAGSAGAADASATIADTACGVIELGPLASVDANFSGSPASATASAAGTLRSDAGFAAESFISASLSASVIGGPCEGKVNKKPKQSCHRTNAGPNLTNIPNLRFGMIAQNFPSVSGKTSLVVGRSNSDDSFAQIT